MSWKLVNILRDNHQAAMCNHSPLKSLWALQEAFQAIDKTVKESYYLPSLNLPTNSSQDIWFSKENRCPVSGTFLEGILLSYPLHASWCESGWYHPLDPSLPAPPQKKATEGNDIRTVTQTSDPLKIRLTQDH